MYVDRSMHDKISSFLSRLEAPVFIQPDTDFQSVDGFAVEPQSWLEMPLMPERPIPFNCAVSKYGLVRNSVLMVPVRLHFLNLKHFLAVTPFHTLSCSRQTLDHRV